MTLPTLNDVQAIEPILTNMLVGYMQADDRFVASRVFPSVSVVNDSGTYYIATKKYWFHDDLQPRAPGASFAELGFGLSTATYKTQQWAGEYSVPDEVRANSLVPMDLEQMAVRKIAQSSLIRKEVQFAADFMTTSVWTTDDDNATTDWDDYASGDPVSDVLTARRTISNLTGKDGNAMVLGYIVHNALVNHPDIIDRIKYVTAATQANLDGALASVFGVSQYMVGRATYSNTNEAAAFSATAIIDDDCLVAHLNPSAGIFDVTAGKTFVWQPGGGQGTMYRDPSRRNHSNVMQHKEQWDQKVVSADLGYFFADVV
jgi:hypothetical protein